MSETVKLIACTFLLTPLREGRPSAFTRRIRSTVYFYSRPCGRGDKRTFLTRRTSSSYFYSRPCGRGDAGDGASYWSIGISTHAPAGGATACRTRSLRSLAYFYSRPCGRGDK